MVIALFLRRLKEGRTFDEFIEEWKADQGFGIPTRVFNAQSLSDPRTILSVGFVALTVEELVEWQKQQHPSEEVRHARIDTVIESTELKDFFDLKTEHDFTSDPKQIDMESDTSLLFALFAQRNAMES